jgi:hypothetical protein
MGFLAVVQQTAQTYPALLIMLFGTIALTLWACKQKRWLWATGSGIVAGAVFLLYMGAPDRAIAPSEASASPTLAGRSDLAAAGSRRPALAGQVPDQGGTNHALLEPGRFSSTVRLHPRFPRDFPVPRVFRLESNSGGIRGGNLTVRFRFRGEASNAVCDLRSQGRKKGWNVEVLAPHRLVFRKDDRMVEAWFSFPARSVVLDIADPQ